MPRQTVCFPIPMPDEGETLEVAVTLDGTTHLTEYRIETVRWPPEASSDARFQHLQAFIREYDTGWDLMQVGSPSGDVVPLTFRKQSSGAAADTDTE